MIELYRCSSSWFCTPPAEQLVLFFSTLSARLLKIYSYPPTLSIGFTKSLQNRRKAMLFCPAGQSALRRCAPAETKKLPLSGELASRSDDGEGSYFSASSSTFSRCGISSGFAIWPFMPAFRAFCLSSSKALAVIAKMGMPALRGSGRARMRRVAS